MFPFLFGIRWWCWRHSFVFTFGVCLQWLVVHFLLLFRYIAPIHSDEHVVVTDTAHTFHTVRLHIYPAWYVFCWFYVTGAVTIRVSFAPPIDPTSSPVVLHFDVSIDCPTYIYHWLIYSLLFSLRCTRSVDATTTDDAVFVTLLMQHISAFTYAPHSTIHLRIFCVRDDDGPVVVVMFCLFWCSSCCVFLPVAFCLAYTRLLPCNYYHSFSAVHTIRCYLFTLLMRPALLFIRYRCPLMTYVRCIVRSFPPFHLLFLTFHFSYIILFWYIYFVTIIVHCDIFW